MQREVRGATHGVGGKFNPIISICKVVHFFVFDSEVNWEEERRKYRRGGELRGESMDDGESIDGEERERHGALIVDTESVCSLKDSSNTGKSLLCA